VNSDTNCPLGYVAKALVINASKPVGSDRSQDRLFFKISQEIQSDYKFSTPLPRVLYERVLQIATYSLASVYTVY